MTFDKFADILVMSRVVAPEAVSDPDNYDDSCTLENVRAAYRRLTTPTTGMTFGQAVTDLGEATAFMAGLLASPPRDLRAALLDWASARGLACD